MTEIQIFSFFIMPVIVVVAGYIFARLPIKDN